MHVHLAVPALVVDSQRGVNILIRPDNDFEAHGCESTVGFLFFETEPRRARPAFGSKQF
jgi:hypothetical protein